MSQLISHIIIFTNDNGENRHLRHALGSIYLRSMSSAFKLPCMMMIIFQQANIIIMCLTICNHHSLHGDSENQSLAFLRLIYGDRYKLMVSPPQTHRHGKCLGTIVIIGISNFMIMTEENIPSRPSKRYVEHLQLHVFPNRIKDQWQICLHLWHIFECTQRIYWLI